MGLKFLLFLKYEGGTKEPSALAIRNIFERKNVFISEYFFEGIFGK